MRRTAGATAGASVPPPPHAAKLDFLGWFAGTWHSTDLDALWLRTDDALWGVALPASGEYEVNLITAGSGSAIAMVSIENGDDVTRFQLASASPERIELGDDQGRRVTITREAPGWRGRYLDVKTPAVEFAMQPGTLDDAPELAELDRAFAADVAAHGGGVWSSHFADDGAEWTDHRVPHDELDAMMSEVTAVATLTWSPAITGRHGDIGFTIGGYQLTPKAGAGQHGSYCTIWRRGKDGQWRIAFDIGSNAR